MRQPKPLSSLSRSLSFPAFAHNRATYGQCSSWAVWRQGAAEHIRFQSAPTPAPDFWLNTAVRDLAAVSSQEDLEALKWRLNPNVVIVALNFAERDAATKEATKALPYHVFHEETTYTSDHRLRDACCGTLLWGGYLTDLVKFAGTTLKPLRDSNAAAVQKQLANTEFLEHQVRGLCTELQELGSQDPVIVALGNAVYAALTKACSTEILRGELGQATRIVKLTHYSRAAGIAHSDYVAKVYRQLREHGLH